jgi:hypothetical protein
MDFRLILSSLGLAAGLALALPAETRAGAAASENALASAGNFPVPNPVLPASFYSRYQGRGLSVDALMQMENSDALLARIVTQLHATTEDHLRMKYQIARLEGLIVIWRQVEPVEGGPQHIHGWIDQRNQLINVCRHTSVDAEDCLRPLP